MMEGCGESHVGEPSVAAMGEATQTVVAMDSGDEITMEYALRVLAAHEIKPVHVGGSIFWSIEVRLEDMDKATRLLRAIKDLSSYLRFGPDGRAQGRAVPTSGYEVDIDASYDLAMKRYDKSTEMGMILRADEVVSTFTDLAMVHIIRILRMTRPFVTRSLMPSTAVAAVVRYRFAFTPGESLGPELDLHAFLIPE
jgi:hypothetical protein